MIEPITERNDESSTIHNLVNKPTQKDLSISKPENGLNRYDKEIAYIAESNVKNLFNKESIVDSDEPKRMNKLYNIVLDTAIKAILDIDLQNSHNYNSNQIGEPASVFVSNSASNSTDNNLLNIVALIGETSLQNVLLSEEQETPITETNMKNTEESYRKHRGMIEGNLNPIKQISHDASIALYNVDYDDTRKNEIINNTLLKIDPNDDNKFIVEQL